MNPEQLAKSGSEHAEQRALFCWANMAMLFGFEAANDMRCYNGEVHGANYGGAQKAIEQNTAVLKWLHAIPNAGARGNHVAAAQLKAEGVKAGVADIFLPVYKVTPIEKFLGLYIELKRKWGKPSDVSKEQLEFKEFVESQGYFWYCAFGWRKAADVIIDYLT